MPKINLKDIAPVRIARGPKSNLPTPPHAFELGRPYFCLDTAELFVGMGLAEPMLQVIGAWDYDPAVDTIDDGDF